MLIDPLDVESIANGIVTAMSDASDLRVRGMVHAQSCSWKRTAELTVQAYRDVLGGAS